MASEIVSNLREARRHNVGGHDQRSPFAKDRDRILYTSAFHRLAGITQIVRAGEEEVFHTRQQHSIKVSQVGRRLAEFAISKYPANARILGIDAEVVEAACLAHDLGHPPFGHAGESELHQLVVRYSGDGFEGNAQTFRILTKLSVRHIGVPGLNLARATLAACLKYPWLRDPSNPDKTSKWSVYSSEKEDFEFARSLHPGDLKTPEADLMDWADDIAYSVHDLEDFHRCNAIPWAHILTDGARNALISNAADKWHNAPSDAISLLTQAMARLDRFFLLYQGFLTQSYEGHAHQRQSLRNMTSQLIARFLTKVAITDRVEINPDVQCEVMLLKQITRDYIVANPSLRAQQLGQARLIRGLFREIYRATSGETYPTFLPHRFRYLWDITRQECGTPARFVADCICSMTERETVGLHARLFGKSSGSVLNPIVR